MQTLKQAVHLAKSSKSKSLRMAAFSLEGCPVGGWSETQSALRNIAELLPGRSFREYTIEEFIAEVYTVRSHDDRYQSLL